MSGMVRSNPFLAVIDEILHLRGCFEALFAEVADASSMTTLQKLVLFAVFEAPVPPTVPQIGRDLGHPRQVIQRIVNELVDADILERLPNPHHKRAMLLIPTGKALAMKHATEERAFETTEAFLGTIGEKRCENLIGELKALRQTIEEHIQKQDLKFQSMNVARQPMPIPMALFGMLN